MYFRFVGRVTQPVSPTPYERKNDNGSLAWSLRGLTCSGRLYVGSASEQAVTTGDADLIGALAPGADFEELSNYQFVAILPPDRASAPGNVHAKMAAVQLGDVVEVLGNMAVRERDGRPYWTMDVEDVGIVERPAGSVEVRRRALVMAGSSNGARK